MDKEQLTEFFNQFTAHDYYNARTSGLSLLESSPQLLVLLLTMTCLRRLEDQSLWPQLTDLALELTRGDAWGAALCTIVIDNAEPESFRSKASTPQELCQLDYYSGQWLIGEDRYEEALAMLKKCGSSEVHCLERMLADSEVAVCGDNLDYTSDLEGIALDLHQMGQRYSDEGRFGLAINVYEYILNFAVKKLGEEHTYTIGARGDLAEAYREAGGLEKSEALNLEVLKVRLKKLGHDHPDVATSYNNLSQVYKRQGRHAEAIECLEKTLDIDLKHRDKDHESFAITYNNLGITYLNVGNLAKALGYLKKAESIWVEKLGPEHAHVGKCLINISNLQERVGDYFAAKASAERVVDIFTKHFGPDNPQTVKAKNKLATINTVLGLNQESVQQQKTEADLLTVSDRPYGAKAGSP